MKKHLLVISVFVFFYGKIWGQNLVPNGGFEQYYGCPDNWAQIDSCLFWMNPATNLLTTGSPDYYHQCATNWIVSIPSNYNGYQQTHSGNAYCAIALWVMGGAINLREYIEAPLTSSLVANSCYNFEMYVNLSNASSHTTDDIGIYFSDTAIIGINNANPLPFNPQINNNTGNVLDSLNWTLVSINYTATGGENFLIIGNFKNDLNTTVTLVNNSGPNFYSYAFIDDVSLTPCVTGINETANNNTTFSIYPNPATNNFELRISNFELNKKQELKIFDCLGKQILKSEIRNSKSEINIQSLKGGMYFIEINGVRKKFVKENF